MFVQVRSLPHASNIQEAQTSTESSPDRLTYTIEEFCTATGMGRTWLYEQIGTGRLAAVKAGARTLVPVDAAREFLDNLPRYQPKSKTKTKKAD